MKKLLRGLLLSLVLSLSLSSFAFAQGSTALMYMDSSAQYGWAEFENAGGQLRVVNQDYLHAIMEGEITGHETFCLNGTASAIGTAEQALWDVPPGTQTQYVFPAAAATVTVVSDDTTDNQVGVGARSVLITGLLAGHIEDTETLLLHATVGTTAVTSAKSWLRINGFEVVTAGTSGDNAGNLTMKSGTDIVSYIEAGTNKALIAVSTVPVDKTVYITSIKGSAAGTKNVEVHVYRRLFGGLWTQCFHRTINDSPFSMSLLPLPEKTDFMIRVHSGVAGGSCDASMEGWIEEND